MTTSNVTIPDDIKEKFPEYIELILGSESMNDEERQYWVNILPVMTPDQLQNLKDILVNERDQLAAIDKKYSKQLDATEARASVEETGQKIKERREVRTEKELEFEKKEEEQTNALLEQIANL